MLTHRAAAQGNAESLLTDPESVQEMQTATSCAFLHRSEPCSHRSLTFFVWARGMLVLLLLLLLLLLMLMMMMMMMIMMMGVHVCVRTVTPDELKKMASRFRRLDVDKNGKLSLDEIQSMLSLQNNPLVSRIFAALDRDGGGDIDFEEFIHTLSIFTRGTAMDKLKCAYPSKLDVYRYRGCSRPLVVHVNAARLLIMENGSCFPDLRRGPRWLHLCGRVVPRTEDHGGLQLERSAAPADCRQDYSVSRHGRRWENQLHRVPSGASYRAATISTTAHTV
jgi:hypothetical protein